MSSSAASYNVYKRVDIETASQGKLIVMLLNGAILKAEEAKQLMGESSPDKVHACLIRAQDIVAELRSALNMGAGEVAENLDRSYESFQHLLTMANVRKDPGPIDECVGLMTTIRDTWEEVFAKEAQAEGPKPEPQINRHGSAVMNLEG